MKKRIVVLGSAGMLGRYVHLFFKSKGWKVVPITRKLFDASIPNIEYVKSRFQYFGFNENDVVINCIGAIPQKEVDKISMIKINALFPHLLANICEEFKCKLIHISTNCVFSGGSGPYNELSIPDAEDDYGRTKTLGEPLNCSVIRTSIIGEESNHKVSLLEWCKSKINSSVVGYNMHIWNGVTCLELAKILESIISKEEYWEFVKHIFTDIHGISKMELIQKISDVFELNLNIERDTSLLNRFCDKRLHTISTKIETLSFDDQLKELKKFSIL